MHGIRLAQNASAALRQALSVWLQFCRPVNSKAIRMIFWTGCLLREYSKDCSIKPSPLPHLKAQAISISDGKPLALQHLKHLHVPQRTDSPPGTSGRSILPSRSQPAGTLAARARPPGTPASVRPQRRGRNHTLGHRAASSPQVPLGKTWFLLATLLRHVSSRVPPALPHAPSQPFPSSPCPGTAAIPLVANQSLSRQQELYEKFMPWPQGSAPSRAAALARLRPRSGSQEGRSAGGDRRVGSPLLHGAWQTGELLQLWTRTRCLKRPGLASPDCAATTNPAIAPSESRRAR